MAKETSRDHNRIKVAEITRGLDLRRMRIEDPVRALTAAITEGVTRDQSVNAGTGLFGSYRVATLSEKRAI